MRVQVVIPTLGESVKQATLLKWHKNDGDIVKDEEPLVELETDRCVGSVVGQAEIGEHVLDVLPRAGLLTQPVVHKTDHPVADQLIVSPPLLPGQGAKPLRHIESDMTTTAAAVMAGK